MVGSSGAGKTTLRRLLTQLHDVEDGSIQIGGIDIRNWPLETLRSLFAYVPQGDDVFIFDDTLLFNILFSRPEATCEEVEECVRQAGLSQFVATLEQKLNTQVGEKGVKLSGGQKQRVALARAILSRRPIIILDEATNSLDAITEKEIQQELETVLKGRTAIIIAHRLNTVSIADRIIVMGSGQIEQEGTHQELWTKGGFYKQAAELQLI